jgi:hypothetical protein
MEEQRSTGLREDSVVQGATFVSLVRRKCGQLVETSAVKKGRGAERPKCGTRGRQVGSRALPRGRTLWTMIRPR